MMCQVQERSCLQIILAFWWCCCWLAQRQNGEQYLSVVAHINWTLQLQPQRCGMQAHQCVDMPWHSPSPFLASYGLA
jgi:hypothetical protein